MVCGAKPYPSSRLDSHRATSGLCTKTRLESVLPISTLFRSMTNYRRSRIEGGTYFFTVALANRTSTLLTDRIDVLGAAFRYAQARHPFGCCHFKPPKT